IWASPTSKDALGRPESRKNAPRGRSFGCWTRGARRARSRVTGYSPYWIGQPAKRYNTQGPWHDQPAAHNVLPHAARTVARAAGGAARHARRGGGPVSYHLGWSELVRLKHSQQLPRTRHALTNPEQQEAFKNRRGNGHMHALGYTRAQ